MVPRARKNEKGVFWGTQKVRKVDEENVNSQCKREEEQRGEISRKMEVWKAGLAGVRRNTGLRSWKSVEKNARRNSS